MKKHQRSREFSERPDGFVGPDLSPEGLVLNPYFLADGVYALMANVPPKDNNGVIIGDKGALVIDAGITPTIALHIQGLVRELTDKPILYLANTTYHGDHTFGNIAFPEDVTIITSQKNKDSMYDLEYEKYMRKESLQNNIHALDSINTWRKPEVTFDHYCSIDLGNKVVELWHFGPGNSPGDTIVYDPGSKIAWTGNYLMREGFTPMLLEGGPKQYIESLQKMKATIDVKKIIPGHGPMGDGESSIDSFLMYLNDLDRNVSNAISLNWSLEETIEQISIPDKLKLPPGIPSHSPLIGLRNNLHRLNIMTAYQEESNET